MYLAFINRSCVSCCWLITTSMWAPVLLKKHATTQRGKRVIRKGIEINSDTTMGCTSFGVSACLAIHFESSNEPRRTDSGLYCTFEVGRKWVWWYRLNGFPHKYLRSSATTNRAAWSKNFLSHICWMLHLWMRMIATSLCEILLASAYTNPGTKSPWIVSWTLLKEHQAWPVHGQTLFEAPWERKMLREIASQNLRSTCTHMRGTRQDQ